MGAAGSRPRTGTTGATRWSPPNSLIEEYFGWVRGKSPDCIILTGAPISTLEYAEQLRLEQEGHNEAQPPEQD
jgi:hypothetical protein